MNETRSELLNDQIQFEKNMQVIEQTLFRYGMIKKKSTMWRIGLFDILTTREFRIRELRNLRKSPTCFSCF